jgi:hypothetical protein
MMTRRILYYDEADILAREGWGSIRNWEEKSGVILHCCEEELMYDDTGDSLLSIQGNVHMMDPSSRSMMTELLYILLLIHVYSLIHVQPGNNNYRAFRASKLRSNRINRHWPPAGYSVCSTIDERIAIFASGRVWPALAFFAPTR